MRVHTFLASSQKEAMQQVRDVLGENAVIMSVSKEGAKTRIVAAIEEDSFVIPKSASKKPQELITEKLREILRFHKLPEVILDKIISSLSGQKFSNEQEALELALKNNFLFAELKITPAKPIILFGMPGIGKTLAISKLAADAVFNKNIPVVITTDIKRAGGVEQLASFTKILQAELVVAKNPAELATVIRDAKGKITLIDTAGVNPFNANEVENLKGLIHGVDAEPVLAMASGGDVEEAVDMCRQMHVIGAKKLLITKADSARRFGSILTAAKILNLEFTSFSGTPNVAHNLEAITPASLTSLLLKPFE